MNKIKSDFITNQYASGVESYTELTKKVGLWESEKYIFEKYLNKTDKILDIGCGTGRTTFPLNQLGFTNIIGVDLTPDMILKAKELNAYFNTDIQFDIGDATKLNFSDSFFDVAIFSFNGLMSIPKRSNRYKATSEIHRVLKDNSIFIFTTHDREGEEQFIEFWKQEQEKWNLGKQNPLLHEFGDLIAKSKNETSEIYIHIPNQKEIEDMLNSNQFKLVETFYRSEKFDESDFVKSKSGECRFWVAQKV